MRNLLHEFRTFAVRGNVVDLAVAVVIGTAFGKIVTSLVDNLIMPTIGLALGGIDFSAYALSVGASTIPYGLFLQSIVDFTIIAFSIFLVVKVLNRFKRKEAKAPKSAPLSREEQLLTEIRDALKRG